MGIACGALRNVAADDDNKVPMWNDERVRSAVIAGAAITDEDITPELREAREHALATLRHLAVVGESEEGNPKPLWMDCEEAHEALLAATKLPTTEPGDRKARDYAIAALRHAVV